MFAVISRLTPNEEASRHDNSLRQGTSNGPWFFGSRFSTAQRAQFFQKSQ
jgi:hypothetical protein